jgi:hypothetical protein
MKIADWLGDHDIFSGPMYQATAEDIKENIAYKDMYLFGTDSYTKQRQQGVRFVMSG